MKLEQISFYDAMNAFTKWRITYGKDDIEIFFDYLGSNLLNRDSASRMCSLPPETCAKIRLINGPNGYTIIKAHKAKHDV